MSKERFETGRRVRSEVLGSAYVEKAFARRDDFNVPWQELLTEYCWGAVWARPTLERKTRSMLNLAMLAALGKTPELATHIRGALRNGVTREEIREVFMQVAVYAGVPCGTEAFRTANAVFDESPE